MNLIDVEQVVLGGTYALLGDHLLSRVREKVRSRVISAPWGGVDVRLTASDEHATLTGAALAVLHRLTSDPSAWVSAELDGGEGGDAGTVRGRGSASVASLSTAAVTA